MTQGTDGAVWFGIDGGAVRYDGLDWQHYVGDPNLIGQAVVDFAVSPSGHVYTASAAGGMYHWTLENEIVENIPNLKAVKKIVNAKNDNPTFTMPQIKELLQNVSTQMQAMIWLGSNCGFGYTDCSELKWKNLDLNNGKVDFPRGKTGIGRNLPHSLNMNRFIWS